MTRFLQRLFTWRMLQYFAAFVALDALLFARRWPDIPFVLALAAVSTVMLVVLSLDDWRSVIWVLGLTALLNLAVLHRSSVSTWRFLAISAIAVSASLVAVVLIAIVSVVGYSVGYTFWRALYTRRYGKVGWFGRTEHNRRLLQALLQQDGMDLAELATTAKVKLGFADQLITELKYGGFLTSVEQPEGETYRPRYSLNYKGHDLAEKVMAQ